MPTRYKRAKTVSPAAAAGDDGTGVAAKALRGIMRDAAVQGLSPKERMEFLLLHAAASTDLALANMSMNDKVVTDLPDDDRLVYGQ